MTVRYTRLGQDFGKTGRIITATDWEVVVTTNGTDRLVWGTPYVELAA